MLATFAAFNQHFVRLWVGLPYYGGDALSVLTAVRTAVVAYFMFFASTIDMAGDTRHRVVVSLPGAILNVVLSTILGRVARPVRSDARAPLSPTWSERRGIRPTYSAPDTE